MYGGGGKQEIERGRVNVFIFTAGGDKYAIISAMFQSTHGLVIQ